jgi:hypothetical protein
MFLQCTSVTEQLVLQPKTLCEYSSYSANHEIPRIALDHNIHKELEMVLVPSTMNPNNFNSCSQSVTLNAEVRREQIGLLPRSKV